MRILFLTFYFEPDLSAGSFRNTALVQALRERLGGEGCIDVLTTLPNRYSSYRVDAPELESNGGVTIRRIRLPPHRSGMADQARAFTRYAARALLHSRNEYDLVFASSSRLFTAFLGASISAWRGVPLYLDIRDIFTETMGDVLSGPRARLLAPFLRVVERFTIRQAQHVNLVSQGFLPYFREIAPNGNFSFFTNGIDEEFLESVPAVAPCGRRGRNGRTILYAGNFGDGQGLHRIIPAAAARCPEWRFRLIGDGGMRDRLVDAVHAAGSTNVEIVPPVNRSDLKHEYDQADVLFLHLNDYPAFRRVLPSKIFEYAATGRPLLAGVGGYAAEFLRSNVKNSAVFPPCDAAGFVTALASLEPVTTDRSKFVSRFRRSGIVKAMANELIQVGRCGTLINQ